MKKRLLFALLLGGMASAVSAQTEYTILQDVTSKLQNADFSADAPISGVSHICTYSYDMKQADGVTADPGLGNGGTAIYGMQAVSGWVASNPSDNIFYAKGARPDSEANGRASGVFKYEDEESEVPGPGLGGASYVAPAFQTDPSLTASGQSLGIVSVWGFDMFYSQPVSFTEGAYMIIVKAFNGQGGEAMLQNNNGFVTDDGKTYLSSKTKFTVYAWENDTIVFRLKSAASGNIQLGYKSGNYGSAAAPHIFIDNVKIYQIDPTPMDQAEIDAQKLILLDLINEGKEFGAEYSENYAVFNNPSATLDEVNAAIAKQTEYNKAATTDLSAYFITNPHFSEDEAITDGITTYDYDMPDPNGSNGRAVEHFGMQPVFGWVASNPTDNIYYEKDKRPDNICNARASGVFAIGSDAFLGGGAFLPPKSKSDGSTTGNLLGFISVWSAMSQYTQQTTLPAGKYTLVISYYNAGGTGTIAKNLNGFITDNGDEYLGERTSFAQGTWIQDKIKFELTEPTSGKFTVGYTATNAGSGAMPHFFIDGITLYYVGEIDFDPSLLALRSAINSAEKALDEEWFNASLQETLQKYVDEGQELVDANSADVDKNKAATDAINNCMADVKSNIAAFNRLKEFYDGALQNAMDKYETTIPALYSRLELLNDDVYTQLEDEATWSNEEIDQTINSLNDIIKEEVQKAWDAAVASGEKLAEDLDISILFNTLGATYSGSALSGGNVVDKQWVYGDASNFKTQYGTMEVWNQTPFEVSQTLKDMPAGKYTISTRAFYRTADNVNNYTNYQVDQTEKAFVFAGSLKTGLCNVAEIASADLSSMTLVSEEAGVYVPNSQQNAHDIFEDPSYDSYTYKSASTVLTETGDLTFGVKADQMEGNCWVVWYTFEIKYNAFEEDILDQELAAKIEELNTFISENEASMTSPMIDQATGASENGEKAQGGTTEDKAAAINAINKALTDGAANTEAYSTLNKKGEDLGLALEQYGGNASEAAVTEATEVLSEIGNSADMTTEELIALSEKADDAMSKLKVPAHDKASDAEPVDFTQMIDNPSFEGTDGTGSLDGWTWNTKATGDTKAADNSNGTYTMENCDGAYVFNTWNGSLPEGGFFVSQTLKNLPAGTYELKAVLASDKDKVINLTAGANGTDFTMENEKGVGQEVSIIFVVEEGQEIEIKASSESWFKADNFRLTYFGTKSEKEPTTGIDDIAAPADMSKAVIYNLAGQRIQTLQKGINIVNGKKVYVK